jgi:preprotein translocase subunit SecG
MQALFLVLQVLVGIGLITLILLQHGKGADAGAAFGSGASATVFGARGSATFLTKATAVLAILFFSNCFFLNYLSANAQGPKSILEEEKSSTTPTGIIESSITPAEEESKTQEPPQSDLPALPGGPTSTGSDLPAASVATPEAPTTETPKETPTPAPAASEPTPKPVEGSEATAEPAPDAPAPAAEPATKPAEPAATEPPPAASKPKAAPAKPEASKKKAEAAPTKRHSPEPKAKKPEQPAGQPGRSTDKKTTEQKTP